MRSERKLPRPSRHAAWVCAVVVAATGLVGGSPARGQETRPYISWFNPPKAPQPLLEHKSYQSAAMNTKVGYSIYLPPGYADAGNAARYPVVYWLHGRGGSEVADQFPPAIVDKAIKDKKVPPLIVVYANGGANSWYADSPDGRWLAATTVIKELIPHVDATYRTVAGREGRAIQGMSMGGGAALRFALAHPELFGSVVSFAGSLRTAEELGGDADRGHIFRTMYGGDAARFAAEHPTALLARNADRVRGRVGIKFLIGTKDRQVLIDGNRRLHAQMGELNVPHEYREVDGVEHNLPKLAAAVETEALEFAARHFRTGDSADGARAP